MKDGHVLPVVCIGGGAGMAPILSLLRHLSETGSTRPVRFYYGARTAADLFYVDEIVELGEGLRDFTFVACLSESMAGELPEASPSSRRATSPTWSTRREPATSASPRSTCAVRRRWSTPHWPCLETHGVPEDQIFYDKFTSPVFEPTPLQTTNLHHRQS